MGRAFNFAECGEFTSHKSNLLGEQILSGKRETSVERSCKIFAKVWSDDLTRENHTDLWLGKLWWICWCFWRDESDFCWSYCSWKGHKEKEVLTDKESLIWTENNWFLAVPLPKWIEAGLRDMVYDGHHHSCVVFVNKGFMPFFSSF